MITSVNNTDWLPLKWRRCVFWWILQGINWILKVLRWQFHLETTIYQSGTRTKCGKLQAQKRSRRHLGSTWRKNYFHILAWKGKYSNLDINNLQNRVCLKWPMNESTSIHFTTYEKERHNDKYEEKSVHVRNKHNV